jgi:anti-sigma-K factor RskA
MNCRGWNPHIALYVEGDLDPDLTRQVEAHLGACVECRAFAEELQGSQAAVHQLRSEIIENASLNRVRMSVLDQVRRMNESRTWLDRIRMLFWGGMRWRYAVLGGAALAVVSLAAWRLSIKEIPAGPQIAQIAVPPAPAPPPVTVEAHKTTVQAARSVAPKKQRSVKPSRMAVADPPAQEEPPKPDTVVRIFTDDPNVVIYWLLDQTGGL